MKTNVFIFGLFLAIGLWSCGDNSSDNATSNEESSQTEQEAATEAETEKQGPEYTSAYICPMHCEGSGSDEPGECPVCGMDYVKNEDVE